MEFQNMRVARKKAVSLSGSTTFWGGGGGRHREGPAVITEEVMHIFVE